MSIGSAKNGSSKGTFPHYPEVNISNAISLLTPATLQKYDISGPRYTSYPTADRFVEAFTGEAYQQTLAQRRVGGVT